MKLRVLVVDDSRFFRLQLTRILSAHPLLEVVGTAADGLQAVRSNRELCPDVITMDVDMPVMDGISAVRRIMRERPVAVLMLSSLTQVGARAALDALDAGAMDFLPKQLEELADDTRDAQRLIRQRVVALGMRKHRAAPDRAAPPEPAQRRPAVRSAKRFDPSRYSMLMIGASTGGPVALQQILSALPADYPLPVVVVQHMPAAFTSTFARRMNDLCRIGVKEVADGDLLEPGRAYIAPGGRQLEIAGRGECPVARVTDAPRGVNYRPSVDAAFGAAANVCQGRVLAVVLTGMGQDGCEGARQLKQYGSTVWAQDEASSAIYGMPRAVAKAGLADRIMSLNEITGWLQAGR